jgi:ribosomal protein S18 acetylase RimI-like enzyme
MQYEVPEITFRLGEPADALCLGVLATQVFLDTYATEGIRPSVAREVLEHLSTDALSSLLADPATVFIIAEAAGHMIGFAQITLGATHALAGPEASAELSRLYIHESATGKGLGTRLLRRAESLVAERGVAALWLTAWAENQRALAFYSSRGYEDLGADLYDYEDDRYEVRIFARKLDRNEPA